jgi:hypothetical protein
MSSKFILILLVLVFLSFVPSMDASAMTISGSTSRKISTNAPVLHNFAGCVPYARSMVMYSGGYSHNAVLNHGVCGETEKKIEDRPSVTIPIVEDQDTPPNVIIELPELPITDDDTPPNDEIIPDEPIDDDTPPADDGKQKCNKGEGNGSEGCDPGNHPELGNDDEDDSHPGNGGGNGHN